MAPTTLTIAICLFDAVANLDYTGPLELFSFLTPIIIEQGVVESDIVFEFTFLHNTKKPFRGSFVGPLISPDRAYDDVKEGEQFDILLVPGGIGASPGQVQPPLLNFLKRQAPGAKYVIGVCTGSWVLAQAGLLEGKRATSNKASFKEIQKATAHQNIHWVAKARWVVDGNYWTASGVTAGIDMAFAFLEHLIGPETTTKIRGFVEASVRAEGDDEFAEFHGLV